MPRALHHYRAGEASGDRRDFQLNDRCRPTPEKNISEAATLASSFGAPTSSSSGFFSGGQWLEGGEPVETALSVDFRTVEIVNTRKWTASGTAPKSFTADGLEVDHAHGSALSYTLTGRWAHKGDFLLRLRMTDALPPATTSVSEHRVWFQAKQISTNTTWSVERVRTNLANQYDVKKNGVSVATWASAGVDDYVLVLEREAAVIRLYFVDDDDGTQLLWQEPGAGPGTITGPCSISIGTTSNGDGAWKPVFEAFEHLVGWHTYSPLASWVRERTEGILFEQFWGDTLDTALWTPASTANADVEVVAGVGDDAGPGLRLSVDETSGVDTASVTLKKVTGDFTAVLPYSCVPDDFTSTGGPTTNVAARLEARTDGSAPSIWAEVRWDTSGTALEARIARRDTDLGAAESLGTVALPAVAGALEGTFRIERRGDTVEVAIFDADGALFISRVRDSDLEYLPTALVIYVEAELAHVSCDFPWFRLLSPTCMSLEPAEVEGSPGVLEEAWPTRSYLAAMYSAWEDDSPPTSPPAVSRISDVTLIDIATRAAVWSVVGMGDGGNSGDQALPAGEVGRPYFDEWTGTHSVPGGTLWVPVLDDGLANDGLWVALNFGTDGIYAIQGTSGLLFAGNINQRQLGMGYFSAPYVLAAVHTGPEDAADGPLYFERVPIIGGDSIEVWVGREGIRVGDGTNAANLLQNDDPGTNGVTQIRDAVVLPPTSYDARVGLVVLAERRGDTALVVYEDLAAVISTGNESEPGEHADAIYTGTGPHTENDSDGFQVELLGAASGGGNLSVHAIRPPSERVADGDYLIAVTRPHGVSLVQHDPATGTAVETDHWELASGAGPNTAPEVLAAPPAAVRLSPDADIAEDARQGWLALQEADDADGRVEVIQLWRGALQHSLSPANLAADGATGVAGAAASGSGLTFISSPPDVAHGLRLVWGYDGPGAGAVEWDLWSIQTGAWRGPHIGGTAIDVSGYGFDERCRIYVGGVEAFRVELLPAPNAASTPTLRAVVRALGWVEHGDTPVMPDAELEGTAEWPSDVLIRFANGVELLLADAYTYESYLCIEHRARRLLGRVPDEVLVNDSKSPTWQRHIMLALAWLICRFRDDWQLPLDRDTYRAEAEGDGLLRWAQSHLAVPPVSTLSDADTAAFALTHAWHCRPTIKALKDGLAPLLGYRPPILEGYRSFTVFLLPISEAVGTGYWADDADPQPLEMAFFDRDYWGGDNSLVEAVRLVIDRCRAAGVNGNVVQLEMPGIGEGPPDLGPIV